MELFLKHLSLRQLLPALVLTAGLALLGLVLMLARPSSTSPPVIGGPFALTAPDGSTRTQADFRGAPLLVFFGYTHCPDVCPATLFNLTQAFEKLGPKAKIRAAFITVDPERDSPAVLKDYMASFDSRIVALSGSRAALDLVYKDFRVYAKKVVGANGDYTMDHTALVYLMDGKGQFIASFNTDLSPEAAAKELAAYL